MTPYTNRELSWLSFNQRVIEESKRADLPLLERVKFLAISASNLDEFYQVRIGGLAEEHKNGLVFKDHSGMTISQQLHESVTRAANMMQEQYSHWHDLATELSAAGITLLSPSELTTRVKEQLDHRVREEIIPILTPVALQYEEINLPITALQLCIVCELESEGEPSRHAIVPIPKNLPRFLSIHSSLNEAQFVLIEEIITCHLTEMFPQEKVIASTVFRLTKNSDIVLEDEDARDLADEMKEVLTQRQFGHAVRVEIPTTAPESLKKVILQQTGADEEHFVPVSELLGLSDLSALVSIKGFEELRFAPWIPQAAPTFNTDQSIFDILDEKDVTLFHPYESFEPVVRMIEEAASDPATLAIKQVLYRTASHSHIIESLKKAARSGKQVTVLIELKARFDEARNLMRAEELTRAGVQVIYGVKGYKTHAKATLIIRKTTQGIKRYVHLGTGNYNETTANLYTDISYLSSEPSLGSDTSLFFNMLTGHSKLTRFQKLCPAPTHMKKQLLELIHGETRRAKAGQRGRILGKMNSLQDPEVIQALYKASKAGVLIHLNVRGICCLQPGLKGGSDNITVVSIIDRYLEHTRAFVFDQEGEERVYISSADWMVRNLEKRLELMIPIEDEASKKRIINYLEASISDNTNAYAIQSNGEFKKVSNKKKVSFRFQEALYQNALDAAKNLEQSRALTFTPHRSPKM